MNTALDTMEAQGREYFGLAKANSSVACVLSALRPGETTDGALKSCHKLGEEHDVEAYMLSLPSLPQMTTCEPMAVLQQGVSGGVVDYSDLPRLAPSKTCSSACCSSLLQEDPVTNSEDYEQAHDEKPPITLEGCVAWFRAEDAAEPWPSTVGSHQGHVVSRKSDMGLEVGHGAKKGVRFLRGDEKTRFDFGEARNFQGCSVLCLLNVSPFTTGPGRVLHRLLDYTLYRPASWTNPSGFRGELAAWAIGWESGRHLQRTRHACSSSLGRLGSSLCN